MRKIIEISYSELKSHTEETFQVFKKLIGNSHIESKTSINNDLSINGDDWDEFLIELKTKFNLELKGLDFYHYFYDEGELVHLGILNLIILPAQVFKYLYFLLLNDDSSKVFKPLSIIKDKPNLTIGDLIASKIEGKFVLRSERQYKLIN